MKEEDILKRGGKKTELRESYLLDSLKMGLFFLLTAGNNTEAMWFSRKILGPTLKIDLWSNPDSAVTQWTNFSGEQKE